MSLRVTFPNSITFTVTNEYGKGAAVEIELVFRPVYHVTCQWVISNGTFRHLSNHVFRGPYFRKFKSYESHLFLKMFKIWCRFQKCTQKLRKSFLLFRQMLLNCLHWIISTEKRILFIGSQCVNEYSWDFSYDYE